MEEIKSIPYIVYESSEAKHERTTKRLIIALIISILVCLITNLSWIWFWNQYDYVSETETNSRMFYQNGAGINVIGNSNGVGYESDSNLHNNSPEKN